MFYENLQMNDQKRKWNFIDLNSTTEAITMKIHTFVHEQNVTQLSADKDAFNANMAWLEWFGGDCLGDTSLLAHNASA